MFVFENLAAHGSIDRNSFATQDTVISGYGGNLRGDTVTSWQDGWRFHAELTANDLDTGQALANAINGKIISGRLNGIADVSLESPRFLRLIEQPVITGTFELRDGVLYKADLEKASTTLTKNAASGETHFKRLAGVGVVKQGEIALHNLDMVSSVLHASGYIEINREHRLKGEIEVGLRKTANLVSIPLVIRGTTAEPHLHPTSSAVIGGVVGTSVLGPGVGTAVGIRMGDMIKAIGNAFTQSKKRESRPEED
jgi:uncharacterized protein involved in outer membrane biogenesis